MGVRFLEDLNVDGNFGIGTTSPVGKLTVIDTSASSTNQKFHVGRATNAGLYITDDDATAYIKSIQDENAAGYGNLTLMADDAGSRDGYISFNHSDTGEKMRVTNGGNVGIGTTSPVNKLDVAGNLSATSIKIGSSASGEGIMRYNGGSGNGIGIVTGSISSSSIGLFVDHSANNRNVGIGTTSPTAKLHVLTGSGNTYPTASTNANLLILENKNTAGHSGLTIFSDNGATGNIYFGDEQSNQVVGISCDNTGGNTDLFFTTNGSNERMRIDGTGNLGIGTSSPSQRVHIVGSYSSTPLKVLRHGDYGNVINIGRNGVSETANIGYPSDATMSFSTSGSERMRIDSSGNVGIGTTSPQRELHVHATNYTDIQLTNDTTGAGAGDGSTISATGSDLYINNKESGSLLLSTNNSERVRVTSSGYVGIGTTSPARKLEVYNSSSGMISQFRSGSGTSSFICFANTGSTADQVRIGSISSNLVLSTNYTERMRINSSGNVGIGTTNPAKKLDVNGDTNITGYLDLKHSSPTGSPLLRFYQSSTRRGFIQMADTNNNLRVASEYGSVSLEAASTSGVDSDTSYIRIKPGGTVEIGAVDGDATISADGSMTFKIDADNDETSQKFSFVNNAGTEVASIDESGNLTLTGGINLSLPTSPGTTGTLFNDRGIVRVS